MALIYIDGFDTYATADITLRWSFAPGANSGMAKAIESSGGRNGTGCIALTFPAALTGQMSRSLGGSRSSVVVGVAVKLNSLANGITGVFLSLFEGSNHQVWLATNTVGDLILGSGSSIITTYGAGFTTGVWYYVELKVTISNSIAADSCIVRVNGTTVINPAAGTNLRQASTTASVDSVAIGGRGNWATTNSVILRYDDLYTLDNSGSMNNDLLGDIRVEAIRPSGNGSSTQFTPVGAANNWDCVDEAAEDGDTSYVASSTVGQEDLYAIGDLVSTPANVFAVQVCAIGRKDDAGSRTITSAIKSGGSVYDHGSVKTLGLGDTYSTLIDVWELDPNGNVAWTGSSVNAMEAGVKLVG